MIFEKNHIIATPSKKPIVYDVCFSKTSTPKPVVIFCHGYKGFKDWGAWDLVANAFAEAGFFFLKFNFSHNGGTIAQPIDFPDLETFAQNNYTKELDDLDRVINHLETPNSFTKEMDLSALTLVGHSRGGGIVLIKAEEDTRVKKVIGWAGVSDFKARFLEGTEGFDQWKRTGIIHIENGRTKQQMPHYFQFYTNFKEQEERLTISRAVKSLSIPHLIVHGDEDPTVTITEARAIHHWNPSSHLHIIQGGNHVFGVGHPWEEETLPEDLKRAVNASIDFIQQKGYN